MAALAKSGVLAISLSIVMVAVTAPAAFANSDTWSLDSNASDAYLFQGSAANPHALNAGMARVTGKVKPNTNDLDKSLFDLRILVGTSPIGVVFDGANIWVANSGSSTVTKLQANTGAVLGTFQVGTGPVGVAFDGANI